MDRFNFTMIFIHQVFMQMIFISIISIFLISITSKCFIPRVYYRLYLKIDDLFMLLMHWAFHFISSIDRHVQNMLLLTISQRIINLILSFFMIINSSYY